MGPMFHVPQRTRGVRVSEAAVRQPTDNLGDTNLRESGQKSSSCTFNCDLRHYVVHYMRLPLLLRSFYFPFSSSSPPYSPFDVGPIAEP